MMEVSCTHPSNFKEDTTGILSGDVWRESPFKNPTFKKEYPCRVNDFLSAATMTHPWFPGSADSFPGLTSFVSPDNIPTPNLSFSAGSSRGKLPALADESFSRNAIHSPLFSPVNTIFHRISSHASKERVYPVDMFLSARKDASHTPHGVLQWCKEEYNNTPSLKVPTPIMLCMRERLGAKSFCASNEKTEKSPRIVRRGQQLTSKVLSILSRLTLSKYEELRREFFELPLMQSDDEDLMDVLSVLFDKASDERGFTKLYARLIGDLCQKGQCKESPGDACVVKPPLGVRVRQLVNNIWENRLQVRLNITDDDKVDRATGEVLPLEEFENIKKRLKEKIVGNLIFCGELINHDIICGGAIPFILSQIFDGSKAENYQGKDESSVEFFCEFFKTVAQTLFNYDNSCLSHYFGVAEFIRLNHPRPRAQIMMEELEQLRISHGWQKGDVSKKKCGLSSFSYSSAGESNIDGLSTPSASYLAGKLSSPKQHSDLRSQHPSSNWYHSVQLPSTQAGSSVGLELFNDKEKESPHCAPPSHPFNLICAYHYHHNDQVLKIFSNMGMEGQLTCIFDFLWIALTSSSMMIEESAKLLLEISSKCRIKTLTLYCAMNFFIRDNLVGSHKKAEVPFLLPIFQKIRKLIIYSILSMEKNSDFNIFAINYFNLIFFALPCLDSVEELISIAYSSYKDALNDYSTKIITSNQESEMITGVLSAASLLVLRFSYMLFPKDPCYGRIEPPPDSFASLRTKFPHLQDALEISLCELIVSKPQQWQKQCVELVKTAMGGKSSSMILEVAVFISMLDVLFTCTVVLSPEEQPLLSVSSAAGVITLVVRHMKYDKLYQTAVLLELLFHCNMYSRKYRVPRTCSSTELFERYFSELLHSGALDNKEELLCNLESLLSGENEKSLLGVYLISLSTKNRISVSSVSHLFTAHTTLTSLHSEIEPEH